MKLLLPLRRLWNSRPLQTWTQAFAAIVTLLLILLVALVVIDMIRGPLP